MRVSVLVCLAFCYHSLCSGISTKRARVSVWSVFTQYSVSLYPKNIGIEPLIEKKKRKFEFEIALWVILSSLWEAAWLLIRILHDNSVCFICLVRILVCVHCVERISQLVWLFVLHTVHAFCFDFLVSNQWQQNNGFEKDKLGYRVSNEQFVPLSIRYDTLTTTGKTLFFWCNFVWRTIAVWFGFFLMFVLFQSFHGPG